MSNQRDVVTLVLSFNGCAGDPIYVESPDEVVELLEDLEETDPDNMPSLIEFRDYDTYDTIHVIRLHEGVDPRPDVEAAFEPEPVEEKAEPGEMPVIFRKWVVGEDGIGDGVIALFPTQPASSMTWRTMNSYEHVGQHASADYEAVARNTRPATSDEYKNLKRELEGQGYENLKPFQCEHAVFQRVRKEVFEDRKKWTSLVFKRG